MTLSDSDLIKDQLESCTQEELDLLKKKKKKLLLAGYHIPDDIVRNPFDIIPWYKTSHKKDLLYTSNRLIKVDKHNNIIYFPKTLAISIAVEYLGLKERHPELLL